MDATLVCARASACGWMRIMPLNALSARIVAACVLNFPALPVIFTYTHIVSYTGVWRALNPS